LKHIALIPARGGSTAIKDKNLQKIQGKSLVKIAWDQCHESKIFDQIILSTDSYDIASEVCKIEDYDGIKNNSISEISKFGLLHKRSSRDSGIYSLVSELTFQIANNFTQDFLWLIQPTAPFRTKQEFKELKSLSENQRNWSSIVSVTNAETIHPSKMFYSKKYLKPILSLDIDDTQSRQLLPKVFIKDGGFYILKIKNLKERIFLGQKIMPFVRRNELNINIDNPEDLKIARYLYDFFN
jgi:CMP-N-acetylneuraminic acid synthetase